MEMHLARRAFPRLCSVETLASCDTNRCSERKRKRRLDRIGLGKTAFHIRFFCDSQCTLAY